jgi:hypothetical protein
MMSEKFWYIVIAAVVILLVVLMLRKRLRRLAFEAMGVKGEVETHGPESATSRAATEAVARRPGISIRNNQQKGKGNVLDVGRSDVEVEGNVQEEDKNVIIVRPDQPNQEEK